VEVTDLGFCLYLPLHQNKAWQWEGLMARYGLASERRLSF